MDGKRNRKADAEHMDRYAQHDRAERRQEVAMKSVSRFDMSALRASTVSLNRFYKYVGPNGPEIRREVRHLCNANC